MRDFIEFLCQPYFYACAEPVIKASSGCVLEFYYQAELPGDKKLVCITETKLELDAIDLLQKIMQAIKAQNLNMVLDAEIAEFDYVIVFNEQPDLDIYQGLKQLIFLPDLQAMSESNELKRLAWQKLKKVFYS